MQNQDTPDTNKRSVISILVDNQGGVLARVSSLFCRRGFNIDSLTVSATNDPGVSRKVGGQPVLGRQKAMTTPWLTERSC